jgi:fumarylacetoacetase
MSVVPYVPDHPFPIQNLPYGVFVTPSGQKRIGVAIGDMILDLHELSLRIPAFPAHVAEALRTQTLNAFMALGYDVWREARALITRILSVDGELAKDRELHDAVLLRQKDVRMVLPADIGDYTDFYASREHATNLGKMFRPNDAPLLENWLHLPVGYHGRASSIVVSGTPLRRPNGQKRPDLTKPPVFGPSMAVDFELEMAAYIGPANELGEPVSVMEARKRVFGFSLFNDWSARDIQKWEYIPLGPFLGKNFGSTISPWIVTMFALEPFLVSGPKQEEPQPLPYLRDSAPGNYDINLTVTINTKEGDSMIVSTSNYKYMYWNVFQQVAHHTVNGCNFRPGDVIASGTISGPTEGSFGSMIELAWQGTKPINFPSGSQRKMIQDGDTVTVNGECVGVGYRIGFGDCAGTILPAKTLSFEQ